LKLFTNLRAVAIYPGMGYVDKLHAVNC